jgi:hypothetical protein
VNLEIDPDVKMVAEFMQERIAASRLKGTADGLAAIAQLLWGQYEPEDVAVLRLVCEPISLGDQHKQPNASE